MTKYSLEVLNKELLQMVDKLDMTHATGRLIADGLSIEEISSRITSLKSSINILEKAEKEEIDEDNDSEAFYEFLFNFINLTMKELGLTDEEVKQGKRNTKQ